MYWIQVNRRNGIEAFSRSLKFLIQPQSTLWTRKEYATRIIGDRYLREPCEKTLRPWRFKLNCEYQCTPTTAMEQILRSFVFISSMPHQRLR